MLSKLGRCAGADETAHQCAVPGGSWPRETAAQAFVDQLRVVGLRDGRGLAGALRVDHRGIEGDVELDVGLAERRPALRDDREQQQRQQPQGQGDGADAQALEQRLAPIALSGECRRVLEGGRGPAVSRASGERYAASVIFFSVGLHDVERDDVEAEGGDEQQQAEREGGQASWRCRTPGRRPAG